MGLVFANALNEFPKRSDEVTGIYDRKRDNEFLLMNWRACDEGVALGFRPFRFAVPLIGCDPASDIYNILEQPYCL